MLQITLPGSELFNNATQEFITVKEHAVQLEHSLLSVSKWESKWKKPFLSGKPRTMAESVDYIRCMTLTPGLAPMDYYGVTRDLVDRVTEYIDDPMTATTVKNNKGRSSGEAVTSELIYYWMTLFGIPFECQKWHLNRLMTLIEVCNAKSGPQKKLSKKDIFSQNSSLNAARKQVFGTKG
jgi:hypothetical protein